jgi:hypothetical protein
MAKYVFIYKGGGMPESEEEGQRLMAAWQSWLDGLGAAVTDIGNPFGASTSVGNGGTSGLTGYTIVEAGSLDDAAAKADGCPILEGGRGSVEVYETIAM